MQLWILNKSIVYTSKTQQMPTMAVKLLYKVVDPEEARSLLESVTSDVREFSLPGEEIKCVAQTLETSSAMLPVNERFFKDWTVGLLERWQSRTGVGRGK